MANAFELDDNQIDQLKELVNLAMGDGAKALGNYTQRFVVLTVPQVNCLPIHELPGVGRYLTQHHDAHAVMQRFSCLDQEAVSLLFINNEYLVEFARLLDRDFQESADQESLLAQLAGLINPVILPRVAKELKISVKLGEVQTYLPGAAEQFTSAQLLQDQAAYNLCFSYALEEPAEAANGSTEQDYLANYRQAKSIKPALALDIIIRGPLGLVQCLSEKFAARLEV